jgi:hypothetical protein
VRYRNFLINIEKHLPNVENHSFIDLEISQLT